MAQNGSLWAFQDKESKEYLDSTVHEVPVLFKTKEEALLWIVGFTSPRVKEFFFQKYDLIEVVIQQRIP